MRPYAEIAEHRRVTMLEMSEDGGSFTVTSPTDNTILPVIASHGGGWDHVSVSHQRRVPNWIEMAYVARIFFAPDETAMQLHVPASEHVNLHPHCLHWWRPQNAEIPRPPKLFV